MKRSGISSLIPSGVLLGGLAFASIALAQPTISNVYPDGARQFQYSPTLSFLASSSAGVTNVTVALTAKTLTGVTAAANLTPVKGLTITGPNTAETVTANLKSNRLYSAIITIQDAGGASASSTVTFDTILPSFTFEAEDFNYTDTNTFATGLYFDNPQTNAYAGRTATDGIDCSNPSGGSASYRPNPPGLATEGHGDRPRAPYIGTGLQDYDVGWNNTGNWGNYTRHFPAGTWNVYIRASNNGSDTSDRFEMSGAVSGRFNIPGTGGYQNYTFAPLTDASSNLVEFVTTGADPETITVTVAGGNGNVNYYLLLPPYTDLGGAGDIVITNTYPDGAYQFQDTNTFSFNVTSSLAIAPADILVTVASTNLQGQGTSQTLTGTAGLTLAGTPNNWNVSMPLTSNTMYTVAIQVTDAGDNGAVKSVAFDTVSPAYTFEAEDWNYGAGQFFDNPQTNAYQNIDLSYPSQAEVDYHRAGGAGGNAYGHTGLATENANDVPRLTHVGLPDFDIGNAYGGNWANYTRTFPSGTYNIYVRVASGNGNTTVNAGNISLVTDPTSPTQTASVLGTFNAPPTGGWQKYTWVPVKNSNGDLARFTGGSVQTLRYTVVNGGHNPNFFMLLPAAAVLNPPYVSDFKPDGLSLFQFTNTITFNANSDAGLSANNVVISVDGVTATGATLTGSPNLWHVSCPVKSNAFHTVIVTLSDAVGTTHSTNKFDTFDPSNFTWEAEDYNFSNGLFYESSDGINVYNGLLGTLSVDYYTANSHTTDYRGLGLAVEGCGDIRRAAWVAGSYPDYNIGDNNRGFWGNYTRTFPAGMYYVYARLANGGGTGTGQSDSANLSLVTSDPTQPNQTTSRLGIFALPYTGGWQTYAWAPLTDGSGNLVPVILDGTAKTVRMTIDGGYCNQNFFMLAPVDPTSSRASVSNVKPDGTALFQFTNTMTFTVTSPAGVATNHIVVLVDGVAVTNLTFSGVSNQWNVACPVGTNASHTVVITVTDANGTISTTNSFSTFNAANFVWEAEDYDYGGGHYFDNPQTNAYAGLGSVPDVDNHQQNLNANPFLYRLNSPAPSTQTGDIGGELPRAAFTSGGGSGIDYCIGFFGGGSWLNYTRHYPAGTYYVIGRFAEGANLTQPGLAVVTSGVGTTNQTLEPLGTFTVLSHGWSTWQWAALVDGSGTPVKITFDGSAATLRYIGSTLPGQPELNTGFFMLVATVPDLKLKAALSGGNIHVSFPTETGFNYQVQYKTHLSDTTWTPLGTPVAGDGTVRSVTDSAADASRFYRVQKQ